MTFGANAFRGALALNPEILSEFHCAPGSSKLVQDKPPLLREEYQSLDTRLLRRPNLVSHWGDERSLGDSPQARQPARRNQRRTARSGSQGRSEAARHAEGVARRSPRAASSRVTVGPPPPPPTPQFMATIRETLESPKVMEASGEQAMVMLKQLASWLDSDTGSGPRTVNEASRALDRAGLQDGLVTAIKNGASPHAHAGGEAAELIVCVQAARCIGLALRNSSLGANRFTAAGCVPALCDVLQRWPEDQEVQRTLVFALRHLVDDEASAIEALYIGASRVVAAAAHRFPGLMDLWTNSAQAVALMAKHRAAWIQRQQEHQARGSRSPSPFAQPPSPPPNPRADLHPPTTRTLEPPGRLLQPNLFSMGMPMPQVAPMTLGGAGLGMSGRAVYRQAFGGPPPNCPAGHPAMAPHRMGYPVQGPHWV